jgi:hypothetical protein
MGASGSVSLVPNDQTHLLIERRVDRWSYFQRPNNYEARI